MMTSSWRTVDQGGLALSALDDKAAVLVATDCAGPPRHLSAALKRGEGSALAGLGIAWADLGEAKKAIGFHEQHLAIARETSDRRGEGAALWNLARALEAEDNLVRAIEHARASLLIHREIEDPFTPKIEAWLSERGIDP